MIVLKTFLKIIKKNFFSFVAMPIVLLLILTVTTSNQDNVPSADFTETKFSILIIDNDKTEASSELADYLKIKNDVKISDQKLDKEKIADKLFLSEDDYVLEIKEGYEEHLAETDGSSYLENTAENGGYVRSIVNNEIESYQKYMKAYMNSGYSVKEASEKIKTLDEDKTEVKIYSAETEENLLTGLNYGYFKMLPYTLLATIISSLGNILILFFNKDIKKRTECSCISNLSYFLQTAAGCLVCVVFIWTASLILGIVCFKVNFTFFNILAIINSIVLTIIVLLIGILVSLTAKGGTINIISTIVSLALSFAGGTFVGVEFLSTNVENICSVNPVMWYSKVLAMLGGIEEVFSFEKYLKYIGVELLFAVFLVSIILVVFKIKRKEA